MWVALIIMVLCALIGCLVSAVHYALRDFSMSRLRDLAEASGKTEAIERVLDDADGHMLATGALRAALHVGITVCAVLVFEVAHMMPPAEGGAPVLTIGFERLALAFLVALILIYVFGLVIPVSVAEHAGERLLLASAGPLRLIHVLASPMRALSVLDVAVKRLAGATHQSEAAQLEEELLSVVEEGEREGNIGESERAMIEAVMAFRSRTAEEIMTPRTEIEGFELTDDLAFIRQYIEKGGHSRTPVYVGDLDHIVGILYAKDLLKYVAADTTGFKLRPLLRRPVWVQKNKPLTDLMYELRARKVHLAIVLDEYGGTAGLVTFEDLLEEIVGEIQDEYEPQDESEAEIEVDPSARAAEVDARAYVNDVNRELEVIGVELPVDEQYDTAAGYVLAALGHIPVAGETFSGPGFTVTVLAAEPTRVTRVRIEATPEEPEGEALTDGESGEEAPAPAPSDSTTRRRMAPK